MFEIGFRGAGGGLRRFQSRSLLAYLRHDLLLVKLSENLSLPDMISVVHQQALHNATGFGFDLHVGNRLYLARGDYALRQISFFHLRQFGRIDFGADPRCRDQTDNEDKDENNGAADIKKPLFLISAVTVRHTNPLVVPPLFQYAGSRK